MRRTEQIRRRSAGAILAVSGLLLAWSLPAVSAELMQSRPGLRQAPKAAMPVKPDAGGRANVVLPTFPQQFAVQGPETDSFGFAVTQPGTIAVDVLAQGAPVVVTLQSPGGQPIIQQGTGLLRFNYNVTPQDVQRSLFWQVQIRAWCEDDCLTAGKRPQAAGSVIVQHPPVDQAAVQKAIQAVVSQQKQPSPQDLQQGAAQATAQMEQAFQQRQAQFDQLQQQRRAALFAQIQPQVDQLLSRTGMIAPAWTKGGGASVGSVRPRGLEETESKVDAATGDEQKTGEGEVGPRALSQMRGKPGLAGQPAAQMPTFPQQFAVQGPESDSFGFAVTQPGPIAVEVQSQGPPIVVTLQHLASSPMTQQGSGQVRLNYEVTPQDIQKSVLWIVKVRLAQTGPPASGTIMVQHPPADQAIVQAQTAALAEQERANQARIAAEAEAQSRAEFQEFKSRFEQQYLQRLAAERTQNQALLNRLRPPSGGMIRSRGLNPLITKINKNEGQPRAQVIIEGANFGPGGEVIFQLGPNITGTGIVEAWSDTVVVANVPDASGLLPYQGTIAIRVGQALSNTVPFRFIPVEDVREIRSTQGDDSIAQPGTITGSKIEHPNTSFGQLAGSRGNDIFFPAKQLSNGWVVQDIKLKIDPCAYPNCRGGYVADSRIRTPYPYFNVRWWHEALVGARYWFSLWIVGPRGVPDGISVTGPLTPMVPPGTPPPATTASNTPDGRTPPSQPPYTPPAPSQPIEMSVVQINPALLIPQYQVPSGSTPSQPPAGQSGNKVAVDPKNPMNPTLQQVPPGSTSSTPPQGGSSPATGGTPPQQPPVPTTPIITSLSVVQGQPGDPVMITGNNFGAGLGEIHFVIANGKDVKAPAGAIWSDNQIFTSVPDASGLLAFNGQVYIKRAADQKLSNLVAFRFEPMLELRRFTPRWPMTDGVFPRQPAGVYQAAGGCVIGVAGLCLMYYPPSIFAGAKGTDQFFPNTYLKNGWTLDEVAFVSKTCSNGCNYLEEKAIGGVRPYFSVRWWVNGGVPGTTASTYMIPWVSIRGPKGVPDGMVMP